MLEINKSGGDQAGQEKAIDQGKRRGRRSELKPASQKSNAGKQLDQKVANRNWRSAIPALASQIQPGDEWDVEVPRDRVLAVRAMRRRGNNAFTQGQAVNANV